MNMAGNPPNSKSNKPHVIRGLSGHCHPFFPATAAEPEQKFQFKNWNELGELLAFQVASAFVDLYSEQTYLGRVP